MNIDIGGAKGSNTLPEEVKLRWKLMDVRSGSDYIYDINSGLPFPFGDNSVDNYYCSMTLEHVDPILRLHFLSEMRRTLVSKGRVRFVVPNIIIGFQWYLSRDKRLFTKIAPTREKSFPDTPFCYFLSWFFTNDFEKGGISLSGHKFGFDQETLNFCLAEAGFVDVTNPGYGKGSEVFAGKDMPRYESFGLYAEARK